MLVVTAVLKSLSWYDVTVPLEDYIPEDPANVSLHLVASVGILGGGDGADLFDIHVCTPRWLAGEVDADPIEIGAGMLIVSTYDYARVASFIRDYISGCQGRTWLEAALRVCKIGNWEFDGDYYLELDFEEWVLRADTLIREGIVSRSGSLPAHLQLERSDVKTTAERSARWSGAFGHVELTQRADVIEVRHASENEVVNWENYAFVAGHVDGFAKRVVNVVTGQQWLGYASMADMIQAARSIGRPEDS
jgi:hypothetical protein